MSEVRELAERAAKAASRLAVATTMEKDRALEAMAQSLREEAPQILEANRRDLEAARKKGISSALQDRLTLVPERIEDMARGLEELVALRDPVGEVIDGWKLPNGLLVQKIRVPLGVVGIIYEARPNVTVDAAGLCLKSGNSVILRGSSSAERSNDVLAGVISAAAAGTGLPGDCITLVRSTDREAARELMRMRGLVDVLIPRGGEGLIRTVVENSTVPVIETGVGNCHLYVDRSAGFQMALDIAVNAKTQRPGVCNACETLLVHAEIAPGFLPAVARALKEEGVRLKGCPRTRELVPHLEEAVEEDWHTEYLDLVLAVRVVDDLDGAIEHIARYGSGHSETIVTSDYASGRRFVEEVDSSAVYINASTRFTDGSQFGMGAEIGISTQKLHARGPMSLPELTTSKFVVYGNGQVRT